MQGLTVTTTRDLDPVDLDRLIEGLRQHLAVANTRQAEFRSAEGPQFIQIVGSAVIWAALFVASSAFLKRIATRAADALWDRVAKALEKEDVRPLKDVACEIARAKHASRGDPEIAVGLNTPDDYFGTCFRIRGENEEVIAYYLARFVTEAETIEREMNKHMRGAQAPLGSAEIRFEDDGSFTLTWVGQDSQEHKIRIE